MSLFFFLFALNVFQVSCSSSEEATEEEVAANEEGGEEGAADVNEEGQQAASNEQANEGGNEFAENNTEGAENNNFSENQGAEEGNNAGLNQGAEEGNNMMANNMGQGGEEDLQQIIEEMNNSSNTQLPDQGAGQGFNNVAGAETGVMENAAMAESNAGSAAPAPETMAPPAAPSGGGMVGMAAGPGLPELGSKMTYIVQKGDTLAKIAQRVYGDSNKWTEIANFTGLANPRLIYPGDVVYYQLSEQSMNFATAYEGMKRNEVQVSQGDTLATIAGRVLGNSSLWKLIWRQNDRIDNPDRLTAGTTLYYIDPASVASIGQTADEKFVDQSSDEGQTSHRTVKSKVQKSVVYEVANDHMDEMVPSTSADVLHSSLI